MSVDPDPDALMTLSFKCEKLGLMSPHEVSCKQGRGVDEVLGLMGNYVMTGLEQGHIPVDGFFSEGSPVPPTSFIPDWEREMRDKWEREQRSSVTPNLENHQVWEKDSDEDDDHHDHGERKEDPQPTRNQPTSRANKKQGREQEEEKGEEEEENMIPRESMMSRMFHLNFSSGEGPYEEGYPPDIDSNNCDLVVDWLKQGVVCSHYTGKKGTPKRRVMWLDYTRMRLFVKAKVSSNVSHTDEGVFVEDVAEVKGGARSFALKLANLSDSTASRALSVVGTEGTLDVVLASEEVAKWLLRALRTLCDSLLSAEQRRDRAKEKWKMARQLLLRRGRQSMADVALSSTFVNQMQGGIDVLKHSSNGKVVERVLFLSPSRKRVFIGTSVTRDEEGGKGIDIDDICEVLDHSLDL